MTGSPFTKFDSDTPRRRGLPRLGHELRGTPRCRSHGAAKTGRAPAGVLVNGAGHLTYVRTPRAVTCRPQCRKALLTRMEIRDARIEDAPAACAVLRRSIAELCVADHQNDQAILAKWLSNKTPEIVASWVTRPGNMLLLAIEADSILAIGSVTDAGMITADATRQFAAIVASIPR